MSSTIDASRVGIVVPAFNCARYLQATLKSIAQQSHRLLECVIVDDGSTDDTAKVAGDFAHQDERFRLIKQANAGVAAARNHGIAQLSKDVAFVSCMDADDIYEPQALEVLLNAIESSSEVVAAHGLASFIDDAGMPLLEGYFESLGRDRKTCINGRIVSLPLDEPTTFASILTVSTVFPPGLLLYRRSVMKLIGGYDENVVPADDWDYVVRLARQGPIAFVNANIAKYRRHQNNQGASNIVPEMCRRVYHKAYFSPENTPEHKSIVRAGYKASQRRLIRLRLQEAKKYAFKGRVDRVFSTLARVPFIAYRYIRGYPTLGWL